VSKLGYHTNLYLGHSLFVMQALFILVGTVDYFAFNDCTELGFEESTTG